jgi:hypothetical protein
MNVSEVAISWRMLRDAGHRIVFATLEGSSAIADPLMLSGEGLDVCGFVPGLRKLCANAEARRAWTMLECDLALRSSMQTNRSQRSATV